MQSFGCSGIISLLMVLQHAHFPGIKQLSVFICACKINSAVCYDRFLLSQEMRTGMVCSILFNSGARQTMITDPSLANGLCCLHLQDHGQSSLFERSPFPHQVCFHLLKQKGWRGRGASIILFRRGQMARPIWPPFGNVTGRGRTFAQNSPHLPAGLP